MLVLFLLLVDFFPSLCCTTHPICPHPSSCCILSLSRVCFLKHTNAYSSLSYLSESLRGHLVLVLWNKRLCCIRLPNAHLTCARPPHISEVPAEC